MSRGERRSSLYGLLRKPFWGRGYRGGEKDLNQPRTGNLFVVEGKKYLSFISQTVCPQTTQKRMTTPIAKRACCSVQQLASLSVRELALPSVPSSAPFRETSPAVSG